MKIGQIIRKVFKGIGVILLFFLVLEFSARVDDAIRWDAPFWANYSHENLRINDSLGFHNRPNARFEKWSINSHGFRGPEITMNKPDGITRVIVVGASESFGLFESERMEYPAQMQTILDSIRPGQYQVINAACPGMSPPRIGHFYRKWLIKFSPDIVVYYPSPLFYLDVKSPSTEFQPANAAKWQPSQQPRLFSKIRIVLKEFIPIRIQKLYKEYQRERYVGQYSEGWVFQTPPPERLKDYGEHVAHLFCQLQSDSVKVIVGSHANRLSDSLTAADRFYLSDMTAIWPRASVKCYIQMEVAGNTVIRDLGDSMGVPVVDLESKIPKSDKYFFDLGHFRNEGATIVANEFVAEIRRMEK